MSDMLRLESPVVLPVPRQWQRCAGFCSVGPESPVQVQVDDHRVERAWRAWQRRLAKPVGAGVRAHLAPIRVADDRGRGGLPAQDGYPRVHTQEPRGFLRRDG